MRITDINEKDDKKVRTSFGRGIAKGFNATQKKGILGPDSFEQGIKNFFTNPGSDPSDNTKTDKKKNTVVTKNPADATKPAEKGKTATQTSNKPLDPKKPVPRLALFTDGRIKFEYNAKIGQWVGSNGKKLSSQDGIIAYNKVDKSKREYVIENKLKDENMSKENTNEGLADKADMAERDHEVQMARADLYKIAKYAIELHDMMKSVTEADGIEGWQQSKITKAADYIGSVYHALDYDLKFSEEVTEAKDTHCSDKCCGADVKREDCKCPPTCKHCNCNESDVKETIKDSYKKSIAERLKKKLETAPTKITATKIAPKKVAPYKGSKGGGGGK